jgi:hypothetical protein
VEHIALLLDAVSGAVLATSLLYWMRLPTYDKGKL